MTERRDGSDGSRPLSRRAFLKRMGLLGGGLVIYGTLGDVASWARTPRTGYLGARVPTDFNAFLRIGADNRVTGFVGKIEMGQGTMTSFAQMLAEELDVAYEAVDMVMGDTDLCPWDAGTWGSLSTRYYGVFVKEAACEAKDVLKALAALEAEFDLPGTGIDHDTIYDHLLANAPPPVTAARDGNLATGERQSATLFETTYTNSYVAHAPMEPHAALASVEGGQATVWASTQSPFGVRDSVAQVLNLPPEKVRVIAPFVGGGFGGKSASAQALEAARLARRAGKPVMVVWTRDEEFFFDTFRPAAVVKIRSGIDKAGNLSLWDYRVYFAGGRGCENFYTIAHHREAVHGEWHMGPGIHPFAVGPWRAPGANTNVYARDLQINIMAAAAGRDPLAFRLRHLTDARMRGVLKAAAERFGWTPAAPPSGRGYGISCGIDAETYVAAMAEVEVDRSSGAIVVKRVVCAQDMGQVVNPRGAALQMEGCITMGLGYALSEEIHFRDGRLLDVNFDTYAIPRFSWLPRIDTVIVPNPSLPPKGGGEPAIVCMGGVLATAVYDATGARPLELPMTPERVRAALQRDTAAETAQTG